MHRDLKTANLMRDRKGVVRVMDFGIAKQHGATGGVTVTATGSLMGTPEYMSPEQLRGEDVDFRGDLYSLGVVIFELFTGALPFRGDTPVATIVRQLHDAPFLDLPAAAGAAAAGAGARARQGPGRPLPDRRRDAARAPGRLRPLGAGHPAGARRRARPRADPKTRRGRSCWSRSGPRSRGWRSRRRRSRCWPCTS